VAPLLFLDSGIGGLSYYRYFHQRNPHEPVVYVADRGNFPYGTKTKDALVNELLDLSTTLTARFSPKLVVAACNTASVSALSALRREFPALPWVGTVPAIKPAVIESRTRRVGVLGTSRTIEDPYIGELATAYGADVAITGIAAPALVDFIERRYTDASEAERARAISPYIDRFRRAGVDAIVLGCTHFLLLLDTFRAIAAPDIRIYDSVEGVCHRVEAILDERRLRSPEIGGIGEKNLLVLTGDAPLEPTWLKTAHSFDLHLSPLPVGLGG
jgi:glutamate racemase